MRVFLQGAKNSIVGGTFLISISREFQSEDAVTLNNLVLTNAEWLLCGIILLLELGFRE